MMALVGKWSLFLHPPIRVAKEQERNSVCECPKIPEPEGLDEMNFPKRVATKRGLDERGETVPFRAKITIYLIRLLIIFNMPVYGRQNGLEHCRVVPVRRQARKPFLGGRGFATSRISATVCCLCAQWLSCAPQHRRQCHVRHDSVAETAGFHDRSVITRSRQWIAIITKSFRPGYRCPRSRDGFCAKGHFFFVNVQK